MQQAVGAVAQLQCKSVWHRLNCYLAVMGGGLNDTVGVQRKKGFKKKWYFKKAMGLVTSLIVYFITIINVHTRM